MNSIHLTFIGRILLLFITLALANAGEAQSSANDLNTYFKPVKWRSIGPFRGGRSVCATGVIEDPGTYYMGTTGGGLWKTDDMGISWNNISDGFFKTGSVGAVTVAPSDRNVIYVGMGEHAWRGVMTSHGDGVYKSTDAGKTWKNMGLIATQHISRIIVHPANPDIVWVAAQGALYSKSTERGLYKSIDGGKTWNKPLYVDDKTGCAELSIDANNPRILYAAMWEGGRLPWKVISGGPGSGLYKSVDGGDTWEKLSNGLPKLLGKMAIAVCPTNSEKVYALIEADSEKEEGGLFVSHNAGKDWSRVSGDHRLVQRAWYYIELFVDPNNENTIYVLSAPMLRSDDGGKSWNVMSTPHGDYHNLWINPKNSNNMIVSNDGGATITFNKGKSWSVQSNQPTAQFYRINVDNLFPYNIYAGQQDNSSVKIASRELASGGIGTSSWTSSAGGESAFLAFDPDDPRYVIGGSYLGTFEILDTKTKASTNVMASPIQYLGRATKDMKYRYNWNAPVIWSKHNANTYYHGSQYLMQTSDNGSSWKEISPDLTRNEKEKQGKGGGPLTNEAVGAENYGTLAYIVESPNEKGVIWTGSDDGLVYITRDNGATWQNVTPAGLKECLVNAIEVSPHDKATAYIATTRYKFNDHTPGLYKTTDYGKTWTNINTGIANNAFTRVVREDDARKDLLYAGTELGVYISFNGGKNWSPFQLNLPITPITDLKVHKGNLIAATSGRSFWILDDLSLIRQYNAEVKDLSIYKTAPAFYINGSSDLNDDDPDFSGQGMFRGINPANGIVIYYTLPKDSSEITIDIKDANGKVVRTLSSKSDESFKRYDGGPRAEPTLPNKKGLNRFVWDLRAEPMNGIQNVYIESSYSGHKVPPGKYMISMSNGDKKLNAEAEIANNPLYTIDAKTYAEHHKVMSEMEDEIRTMHTMINEMANRRELLEKAVSLLPDNEKGMALKKTAQDLIKNMKEWDTDMIQRKSKAYDDVENYENKFTANYMFMRDQSESDLPRINKSTIERLAELNSEWSKLKSKGDDIMEKQLPGLNKALWENGVGILSGKQVNKDKP